MLDSLIFILEKLILLAHVTVSGLLSPRWAAKGDTPPAKHFERAGVPTGTGGAPQHTHSHHHHHHHHHHSSSGFHPGDLLEVPRTLFTHFGIYLGEDRVAHLIPDILPVLRSDGGRQTPETVTNTRLLLGVLSKNASVRVDRVEDFAYGAAILLNAMDRVTPRPPLDNADVAQRAEKLVGGVKYSLLWNNCEHFVTHCRYGAATSSQTEQFCEWCKSLIRDQRCLLLSVVLGVVSMACWGVSPGTVLPSLLVPFTLWMVS
ncbi:hypothetical protein NHX12_014144 [Muraenolepis orangiensis]|uniref:LRAT domain-containing protein n=1 Tax=Muraenolepis orangiensis TaxID=630683 RepID=A0A9Q0DEB9_9TELE|nr:hypothetical protein NHX12_014144 [Muraenolepis orangiensis]